MIKGRVSFNENTCKGCGLCVSVCPVKILKLDTSRVNAIGYTPAFCFEPEKCIACTSCALICPDVVITVERLEG
jgi:2-oxoglutarate ferredoxin oxidoreductase subunit delta